MADAADIDIIRGNNYPPATWQFLQSFDPDILFPLSGSTFKLTIAWSGMVITPPLAIDAATSTVQWNYSTDDSRGLPLGRQARYEIERWTGAIQQTLIRGHFVVSEGDNPD